MQTLTIVCPQCHAPNPVKNEVKKQAVFCSSCCAPLHETRPMDCTDETARVHIEHDDIPVLIDFYSPDCAPCMQMAPDYEEAAKSTPLEVRFLKIDTTQSQELARLYGVNQLPTIIAFKNGQEVNRFSSRLSKDQLSMWAESLIQMVL